MADSTLTAADILEGVRTAKLTTADRVAILRALRDSTPGLVAADRHLLRRIRSAQAVPAAYIDTTINALENSAVWQQSASTNPEELREHRTFSGDHRNLYDEVEAFADILKYNIKYHHFLSVEKARTVFKVGREMSGAAGLSIRPHLTILAEARPSQGRKRRKPDEPIPPAVAPKP